MKHKCTCTHTHTHTHTHKIQDADGAYGTVLVAPSVTPYGFMNPSFRTFTMDAETFQLLDYQQYHLNLTKANGEIKTKFIITSLKDEREARPAHAYT